MARQLEDSEMVYAEREYADELYVVLRGRVNFILDDGVCFKSYLKTSYFGEGELLTELEYRLDTALSCGVAELLTITKHELLEVLEDFPLIHSELKTLAQERIHRHQVEKTQMQRLVSVYKRKGTIKKVAGRLIQKSSRCTLEASPKVTLASLEPLSESLLSPLESLHSRLALLESRLTDKLTNNGLP